MKKTILLQLFFALASFFSFAQPGSNDPTFNPFDLGGGAGDGTNGVVSCIVTQSDAKVVIAGDFSSYNTIRIKNILRLNRDGSLDPNFELCEPVNGSINSAVAQPDGKIIIAGDFTILKGLKISRIARLNTNGSLDTTFKAGSGFDKIVRSMAIQADGKIIVGGDFTAYNGANKNRLLRLNTDGRLDASFDPGTGFNAAVRAIAVMPDDKLIVGGDFVTVNGKPQNRLARLNPDGSFDDSFFLGEAFDNNVMVIKVQPDGKIMIGGLFTSFDDIVANRIIRLDPDGRFDTNFFTGLGFDNLVRTIAFQSDGKMLVGGLFTSFNEEAISGVARLNPDGSLDNSFDLGHEFVNVGIAIVPTDQGQFYVSGMRNGNLFSIIYKLMRLNADGSIDASFNRKTGFSAGTGRMALQQDGKMIVTGDFQAYNGTFRNSIARLNPDGSLDASFDTGTGFDFGTRTVALQPDGKIIVGGLFFKYKGIPRAGIARLYPDGSLDESFDPGLGFDGPVEQIVLQADGKILVCGAFKKYDGNACPSLVRLEPDGYIDQSFQTGTGFERLVRSISLQPDGKIIVGGDFLTYNGVARNRIARLNTNGSLDLSFEPAPILNAAVYTTAVQADGKIIAGGLFDYDIDGNRKIGLARLNADGRLDDSFGASLNPIGLLTTLVLQADGKMIVGGRFNAVNETPINGIARLHADGSLDPAFDSGTGFNDIVNCLALQKDGKIMACGRFTAYNGVGRNRIARLMGDAKLDTKANPDPLTIQCSPNPSKGSIFVSLDKTYEQVQATIYNAMGQQITSQQFGMTNSLELNIEESTGLYLLDIKTNSGLTVIAKVIKR